MFEVGDRVIVQGFDRPIHGVILNQFYDEGIVYFVLTDGGNHWDCNEDELTPEKRG